MITLISGNKAVKNFLGIQNLNLDGKYRKLKYLISERINDDILIYNLMTKELVILDEFEYSLLQNGGCYRKEFEELIKKWYLVPKENNDFVLQNQLTSLFEITKSNNYINIYTIFTTTDCNARCHYCFESGCQKVSMSDKVAEDVAKFIIKKSNGHSVNIEWFGGEPLYNEKAIDIITNKLLDSNINFKSSMTTNGFLFSKKNISKSIEKWHLKKVQITLDGTEETYNKIKKYIYKDVNAFKKVWGNIALLLKNGIAVRIRYNIDVYNEKDIYELTDALLKAFEKYHNFSIDPQIVMQYDNIKNKRDYVQNIYLYKVREQIQDYLENKNVLDTFLPSSRVKLNRCVADNDCATTILPDGSLGKCATYTNKDTYGTIYSEYFDENTIRTFKERKPILKQCEECAFYPNCIELEKCPSEGIVYCDSYEQNFKINALKRSMKKAYNLYHKNINRKQQEKNDEL